MPDWEFLEDANSKGLLNDNEKLHFDRARRLGKVPGKGADKRKHANARLSFDIVNSNADSMRSLQAESWASTWLKLNSQSEHGSTFFSNTPEDMSGIEKIKRIQKMFNPVLHPELDTEFDKWVKLDDEQKEKALPTFTKENLLQSAENFAGDLVAGSFGAGSGGTSGKALETKTKIDAERGRLLRKDNAKMRMMLESVVVSDAGRSFANEVVKTGIWDENFFMSVPPEERQFMSAYIQSIKIGSTAGVMSEAGSRFASGVKDITAGSLQYVAEKTLDGWYGAKASFGTRDVRDRANQMLDMLNEVQIEGSTKSDALAEKFAERGAVGKAITGIAASAPLMASFFINTPAAWRSGAIKTARGIKKLGLSIKMASKLGLKFSQLIKHAPVAMATFSMARDHETLMLSQGVAPEFAKPAALATAIVNMYVEKAALDQLLGVSKARLFDMASQSVMKKMAAGGANFLYRGGKGATVETLEEMIQGTNEEFVTQLGLGRIDTRKLAKRALDTFVEVLPTTIGFGLLGGVGGAGYDIMDSASPADNIEAQLTSAAHSDNLKQAIFGSVEISKEERQEGYSQLFNEWVAAPDENAKLLVLTKNNVADVEKAHETFLEAEGTLTRGESIIAETAEGRIADIDARAEAAEAKAVELRELGFNAQAVDVLSGKGGLDASNAGQFKEDGGIEISKLALDPSGIGDHEAMHGAIAFGAVTEAELQVLRDSNSQEDLNAVAKAYAKDAKAGDIDVAGLSEEAISERYKTWKKLGTQEKTVMRKLMDFFARLSNFVRGKGFKTVDDIFAGVEPNLRKILAGGNVLESPSTPREAGLQTSKSAKENKNLGKWNGKEFWSGAVNTLDGVIEEVHTFEKAQAEDFHHNFYFSDKAISNMNDNDGDWAFFWVDEDGKIQTMWREDNSAFRKQIADQIEIQPQTTQPKAAKESREGTEADDAVEFVARTLDTRAKLTEPNVEAALKRIGAEGLDAGLVLAQASELQDIARKEFGAKVGTLFSAASIRKAGVRRKALAQSKKIRRQGFVEGKLLEQVKARIAKDTAKTSAKSIRAAKTAGTTSAKNYNISGDVDADLAGIQSSVRTTLATQEVKGKGTFEAAYKSAMSRALQPVRRRLKFDGLRESAVTRMNAIKADKTKIATAERLFKEVVELERKQIEKRAIKGLRKQFESDLNLVKGASNPNTLNINRKVDVDTERYLKLVKSVYGMSKVRAQEALDDLNRTLEHDVFNDSDESKSIQSKWERMFPVLTGRLWGNTPFSTRLGVLQNTLTKFGGLKKASLDELAGASVFIEQAIVNGKAAAQRNAEQFNQSVKNIGKALMLGTQSRKTKDGKIKRAKDGSGAWTAPFNIMARLQDFSRFGTERMQAANTKATQMITDLIQNGSTARDTHMREGLNQLAEGLVDIYGGTIGGAVRHIERLTRSHKKWAKYNLLTGKDLSIEQMLQAVAIWEQDDIKHNLKGASADFTQEIVDQIKSELDPKDLELLDWMRDFYVEEGIRISVPSQELFGTDVVAPVENYMPVIADVARLWSSTEVHGAPLTSPTMRDRQVHSRAMDFENGILSMFEDRLRRNANFVGYAKTGHILKEVYGDADLVGQMQLIHGTKAVNGLFNHLTDIVTNSKSGMWTSKILNKLRGMVGLMALSGNFKVMITQLTSAPAFALEYGIMDFAKMAQKGLTDPRGYMEGMQAIRSSDQWANRKALGTSEFVENALRDNFGSEGVINDLITNDDVKAVARTVTNFVGQLYKKGMVTNAMGDAAPIFLIGPTVYMQQKADALMDGLSEEAAKEVALERTWGVIQRSQQSYSPKDQAAWVRRGGLPGRMLAQFTTTPAQYLSFEVKAIRDLIANPTAQNIRKALNVVAVNHVVLAGGYFLVAQFISNFLRDDEWDEEDTQRLFASMLLGPGSGIIVFGTLAQDFLEAATTGKKSFFGGGAIPMVDTLKRTGLDLGDLIKHMTYDFDLDEALEDADEVMQDFSAPFRQARQISERIKE